MLVTGVADLEMLVLIRSGNACRTFLHEHVADDPMSPARYSAAIFQVDCVDCCVARP